VTTPPEVALKEHDTDLQTRQPQEGAKIIADRSGALQTFTLDRPHALNAFDHDMCLTLSAALPKIARNPDIYIVAIRSSSPKVFCAGGDVVALAAAAKTDPVAATRILRDEYALNWLLECFSKPTVSFVDGLCLGSGAGLSAFNTHRVAGENFKWGMPETKIGFFPDVGIARVLAKMPWPMGMYLGLTGRTMGRADAQWLGVVTHCIAAKEFDGILTRLANAEPVDPMLDGLNEIQPPGELRNEWGEISRHFSEPTLAGIFESLERAASQGSPWAGKTLGGLKACAPLSLAIAFRHIQAALRYDIRETLIEDFRICTRVLADHDFGEGVRAALIDKDRKPAWRPDTLSAVTPQMLDGFFARLPDGELVLPSRSEMQAARV
jgi:enoyl-CoA hydratase